MDKRIVGQWRMESLGETVNIFDETPLRAKLSFDCSGHFNFEPNCIYEKDGYLCWEINDETYRMVYHVKLEDDQLKGYTTQFNQEKPIEYVRISDVPEDALYRHEPMEQFLAGVPRINLLRDFADYDRSRGEAYETEYVLGEKNRRFWKSTAFPPMWPRLPTRTMWPSACWTLCATISAMTAAAVCRRGAAWRT